MVDSVLDCVSQSSILILFSIFVVNEYFSPIESFLILSTITLFIKSFVRILIYDLLVIMAIIYDLMIGFRSHNRPIFQCIIQIGFNIIALSAINQSFNLYSTFGNKGISAKNRWKFSFSLHSIQIERKTRHSSSSLIRNSLSFLSPNTFVCFHIHSFGQIWKALQMRSKLWTTTTSKQ